jgi:hypothetical protein
MKNYCVIILCLLIQSTQIFPAVQPSIIESDYDPSKTTVVLHNYYCVLQFDADRIYSIIASVWRNRKNGFDACYELYRMAINDLYVPHGELVEEQAKIEKIIDLLKEKELLTPRGYLTDTTRNIVRACFFLDQNDPSPSPKDRLRLRHPYKLLKLPPHK